jgi:diguanylate cyclase (GGDEF)-like protein
VVETARGSHDPSRAADPDAALAAAVARVHVAGALADVWGGAPVSRALDAGRAHLGLEETAVHELVARMGGEIPAVAADFEVALTSPAEIHGVLERAKEALVLLSARSEQTTREAVQAAETLAAANRDLAERSRRDALTGVLSRAQLDRVISRAFAGAADRGTPLTVAFCDIDLFKRVNDAHGHAAGDRVLAGVASAIARGLRPGDAVGRFGGEEFVVVLPDTDAPHARQVAESIRREVEAAVHAVPGAPSLRVTVSIGHATHPPGEPGSTAALLAAADACLYEAKRTGRNRVVGRAG